MASTAPSATLLNTQLSAENVALKDELRVLRSEFRSLALANARLADKNEELIATQAQLKAALEHLLSKRPRRDLVDPNQGSLFVQEVQALADSIGSQDSEGVDPVAELSPEDQQVPDGESPSDPEPKPKPKGKKREPSRRVADESNLRHEVVRSELPLEQRRCAVTGLELVEVGVKVTKELDYRPGELVVLEHHQVIYGAPPEVAKDRKIEQVFAPASQPVAMESQDVPGDTQYA